MKRFLLSSARCLSVLAIFLSATLPSTAQDAIWDDGAGDGLWNSNLNWDTDLTPGELTNAFIDLFTVNYDAPMSAASINTLSLGGLLNINAGGFVVGGSGNGAVNVSAAGSSLVVNNGGAMDLLAGGLTQQTNASVAIFPGGSLTIAGALRIGNLGGSSPGSFMTNYGGTLSALSTTINPGNSASTSQTAPAWRLVISGGINDLGDVIVQRSPSASGGYNNVPLGSEGLVISNGLVRMTSLDVGGPAGNSWLSTFMAGGIATNTGAFTVRAITAGRASRFFQNGGLFVSTGGGPVRLRGHTANNSLTWYFINGGTNLVDGFVLTDVGDVAGTVVLSNSAKIYIGSSGFDMGGGNLSANGTNVVLTGSGTFGAQEDWTGTVPITLAGGTFDAAALDGTPHNITLQGVLRGPSGFTKTGGGVLTLDAANTYTGDTVINAGTVALGADGSVSSSLQIILASNTVFDVSGVSGGFVLNDSRTLAGFGVVTGNVSVASGGRISPGISPGTLTLTNDLTATGGARFIFELSNLPAVPAGNDLLIVGNDLNVSGVNNIEVSGPVLIGGAYPLIKYGGSFNGTLANFDIVGPNGILSNSVATKTIYLIPQTLVRPAANVVWSGKTSVTGDEVWNTQGVTNWIVEDTSPSVTFVTGDSAFFRSNSPAIHTNVTISGTVEPDSVTVDSTADYTFSGAGRIGGDGGLVKTSTGKLTVLTTNLYTGPTVVDDGVLEVAYLANGTASSSIGAANSDSTNLVLSGGTLRYVGDTAGIDRGASLVGSGGIVDIPDETTTLTLGGTVTGDGSLTKTGDGTLALSAINNYSGGTTINGGVFQANANAAAGTGGFILNNTTIRLGASAVNLPNTIEFNGNCVVDLGSPSGTGDDRGLVGAWTGTGTVLVTNLNDTARTFTAGGNGNGGGSMAAFSGILNMGDSSGFLRFNNDGANNNLGSSSATFNLGTGSMIMLVRNGGVLIEIGELLGGPSTILRGRASGTPGTVTYSIGAKNVNSLFEGTIADSTTIGSLTALVKVGNGKLTLTGNSTYTGDTLVSSGELQINGFNNSANVLVQGGTLSGNGDYIGTVQIDGGTTLSPGASIGTMTINNSLTMNGNLVIEVNKAEFPPSDIISLGGAFAGVGTITVSNLGPALVTGDKFYPFNGATFAGAGALTVSGAGVEWINNLETDGSIEVSSAAVQPEFGTIIRSGNSIIINGSGGPTSGNYIVLASTNIATAISAWTPILTNPFNPDGSFSITNTIVPGTPRLFYTIQIE